MSILIVASPNEGLGLGGTNQKQAAALACICCGSEKAQIQTNSNRFKIILSGGGSITQHVIISSLLTWDKVASPTTSSDFLYV